MTEPTPQEKRLSSIVTDWDGVMGAKGSADSEEVARHRSQILARYSGCVHRYILAVTKNDRHVAEDLSQEFALRFVRGDYQNVDPAKGRFRDYIKASLRNLVFDHFRHNQKEELLASAGDKIADDDQTGQLSVLEKQFNENWRQQLLTQAWSRLAEFEKESNNWFHTVLIVRSQNPDATSDELAALMSEKTGEPVTSDWVRQKLHRGRKKFSDLVTDEIRSSLSIHDKSTIEVELAELGLQKYIQS